MVGTNATETIYRRLIEDTGRFLRPAPDGQTVSSPHALAVLVTEILTEQTATVRTEIRDRLAAAGTSRFLTVDGTGRCVQINLCALADLVNAIITEHTADLRDQVARWQSEAHNRGTEADWLDRAVRIALNVPRVGGSTVEWAAQIRNERDEFAKESEHRESEILEVLAERDEAEARVAELESTLAGAGEPR